MTEVAVKETRETSSGATIIPFPAPVQGTSSDAASVGVLADLMLRERESSRLRAIVEETIAQLVLENALAISPRLDDPFDAVYISALVPDVISPADVTEIKKFSGIKDVSETLVLDDGWDD